MRNLASSALHVMSDLAPSGDSSHAGHNSEAEVAHWVSIAKAIPSLAPKQPALPFML